MLGTLTDLKFNNTTTLKLLINLVYKKGKDRYTVE